MGKEVIFVGKSQELGTAQPSGLANESSVGNQSAPIPDGGVIFDFTMSSDSARTTIVDPSNCQPEIKPVITPVDLVKQARESGIFITLPVRQRIVLDYLFPEAGKPLNLKEAGSQMGHISKESVRKLKKNAFKRLKSAMNVDIPLVVIKTQAMREIEAEYNMPIEQVLKNLVLEGLNKAEIGRKFHANRRTISDWFDKLEIEEVKVKKLRKTPLMPGIEQRLKKPVEQILRKKYISQKKSFPVVAYELGVDENTVGRWLNLFEIPIRTHKEAMEIALSDSGKRRRITRKTPETRRKLSESVARYHRERRKSTLGVEKVSTS